MSQNFVMNVPVVVRDPRFRAGRILVQRGQFDSPSATTSSSSSQRQEQQTASSIFASLLEETRRSYGEDDIESAPAYYEYGNAIFRAWNHDKMTSEERREGEEEEEDDGGGGGGENKEKKRAAKKPPSPARARGNVRAGSSSSTAGKRKKGRKSGGETSAKQDANASAGAVRKLSPREAAAAAAERRAKQQQQKQQEKEQQQQQEEEKKVKVESETGASTTDADAVVSGPAEEEKKWRLNPAKEEDKGESLVKEEKKEGDGDDDDDEDDVHLALEMMETSWSILDRYVQSVSSSGGNDGENDDRKQKHAGADGDENNDSGKYVDWAVDQIPRVLTGIGDVLGGGLRRHADAADAYSRALEHRQGARKRMEDEFRKNNGDGKHHDDDGRMLSSIDYLRCRRRIAEACTLVAEEILRCPDGADVVTTETESLLVRSGDRIDFARGYYDRARDELQEAVLLMGRMTARGAVDVSEEKRDICFVSTMIMGLGMNLAQLDEQQEEQNERQPPSKKNKRAGIT